MVSVTRIWSIYIFRYDIHNNLLLHSNNSRCSKAYKQESGRKITLCGARAKICIPNNLIIANGKKHGRISYYIDQNLCLNDVTMNSFDEHNCGYKEACKKEIMEYISSEIENLNVEYLDDFRFRRLTKKIGWVIKFLSW